MITILHGDDIVVSRKKLSELKKRLSSYENFQFEGEGTTVTDVVQVFEARSLFGNKKLIYYMGGVDNWFTPKFNYNTPISYTANYAYQTLATPMRGFIQNIRNGNSFALYNTELRLPVFRYLMNKPLKSDFFNNFQVVGFGDVGTAWTGKSPYDDTNSLNTQIVGGQSVTVVIQTRREPIVAGYGWGIRSRLLGYFMRLDWSHGWEDGKISKKKVFYWSFSLDF